MPGSGGIMSSRKGKTEAITDPLHCVVASVKPQIGKTLTWCLKWVVYALVLKEKSKGSTHAEIHRRLSQAKWLIV